MQVHVTIIIVKGLQLPVDVCVLIVRINRWEILCLSADIHDHPFAYIWKILFVFLFNWKGLVV